MRRICVESQVEEPCLYQYFGDLEDPRSTVNRKHLLVDEVGIAICGVVAGADGPDAIAVWAKSKKSGDGKGVRTQLVVLSPDPFLSFG